MFLHVCRGRIYRMIDVWTRHKVFRQERLDELDTMMSKYMTDDEKAQALEQQSAAGVKGGDPRKRAAAPAAAGTEKGASVASSAVPAAKRPMINDPRLAQKNAAAVPSAGAIPSYLPPLPAPLPMLPILPLTPPPPPVPSSELAVLEGILDGPEVQSRPDLQPMVQLIRSDLKRPMPPAEMKAVIIAAAQQLMKALTQKPQTQTVFMTQPPRVWNPAAAATTVAAASASVPSMTAKQLQQSELHLSATFSDLDLKTRVAGASDALFAGRACKQCGRRFADAAMAGHLEWHRLMAQRKKLLDDTGLGNSSSSLLMGSHQKWYWEEWEWIQAPDVIFGVQTKAGEKVQKKDGTASSGGAASSQGRGPGAQAVTEKEDGPKYEAQSVVADDAQKKCPVSGRCCNNGAGWLLLVCSLADILR
jgi:hypothetical protein